VQKPLDNFASLPPLTKNFYIPTDVISNALNACGFPKQRHKFAINLMCIGLAFSFRRIDMDVNEHE
jgi:hypothetical protein